MLSIAPNRLNAIYHRIRKKIVSLVKRNDFLLKTESLYHFKSNILLNIEKADIFISVGPAIFSETKRQVEVALPPLNLYLFENSIVNSRSSCIVYKNQLVKEYFNLSERFNVGFIKTHTDSTALIKRYEVVRISEGLFLGGNGSWNWYHWIIEILPRTLLLNHIKTKTLLVSDDLLKYSSMLNTLKAVVGDSFHLVFMSSKKNYLVKKLYYVNGISYMPFNLPNNTAFQLKDSFIRSNILIKLRNTLVLQFAQEEPLEKIEKIFLYRATHRTSKNQDHLLHEMQKEGFKSVNFDGLTVQEQIHYMQSAKVVMGITGAAFTNLIFANPGTKFICLMQKGMEDVSCFSNLANIFDIDLYYHFYTSNMLHDEHYSSDFELNIVEIVSLYKRIIHG